MQIPGICQVCGNSGRMHTCHLCGGLVCFQCFNPVKGICKSCESGIRFEHFKQ